MLFRSLIGLFLLAVSSSVAALDYPLAFRGKYVVARGDCRSPALVIDQSQRINDVDVSCALKKINSQSARRLVAEERCDREGREWLQKVIVELDGGVLRIVEGKNQSKYKSCSLSAGSPVAKAISAKALTCKLNPGQAGVTTFLDANLSRPGRTIRDFDGYVFKATGKIRAKKIDVLEGQLLGADGKIAEAKSYAMADEWECR
jgi:hypothetical protein